MTAVALSVPGGEFPRPVFSWLQGLNSEGAAPVSPMIKRVPGAEPAARPEHSRLRSRYRRVMDNNTCAAFQQRRPVTLDLSAAEAVVDPKEAAEHAGPHLRQRRASGYSGGGKAGKGFRYVSADGGKVRDADLEAHQVACRSTRLDRCLDMPKRQTAISRPPAATRGDASNTATMRAFAKSARARSTSTCWPSRKACPPSARR